MRSGLAQDARQGHSGAQRGRSRKQSAPQRSCLDSGLNQDLAKKSSTHADNNSSPKQKHHHLHAPYEQNVVLEAPSIPAVPVPPASSIYIEPVADTAAAQHAVKKRKSRVRHAPKTGCCSFCFATESPMWRNGPEPYPRLCNACGMRYFRCMAKKPPQDPFSAKILANMLRKAAKAGKSSSAALTAGTNHPALAHQDIPAAVVKPKQARKHSQRSKAAVQAAATVAASADHVSGQRAAGKRVRKASAKALAYEEELREQELFRHSKVARRPQQQQDGYEATAVSWDMSEDPAATDSPSDAEAEAEDGDMDSMQEAAAAAGPEPQEHQQQSAANAEQHVAGAHASDQVAAVAAAKLVALAQAILQERAKLVQPAQQDGQYSLQEGQVEGAAAVGTATGSGHGAPGQHMGGERMSQKPHAIGSLHHMSSLDSAATG